MTGDELEELTFRHMPESFFRKALTGIYKAHDAAWRSCYANHADPEAENLLPFERRARVEGNLLGAAELIPGLTASSVRTDGAWWNHVEVRGGPVVVTESAVPYPCAPVRSSMFRDTLARNNQGVLFEDDAPLPEAPLYVLLLHSRYHWLDREDRLKNGYLPGSAYLAWPAPDLSYVHVLNLFEKFPDVIKANTPQNWDIEARIRYIHRSRRVYGL